MRLYRPVSTRVAHSCCSRLRIIQDDEKEANHIGRAIQQLLVASQGRVQHNDFAICFRTHFLMRKFEEALNKLGIPYNLVGATSFYEREEINDLVSYLTVVANPRDDLAFLRIVNVPARGVGAATLQSLKAQAALDGTSLFDAARKMQCAPELLRLVDALRPAPADERSWLAPNDVLMQVQCGRRVLELSWYHYFLTTSGRFLR
jgi:DNA helicase-2/ATP-dependent DNA helicase PcrA